MSSARLTFSPSVVTASVGEEAVLLDSNSGIYFGLNPVAARVWELAGLGASVDEIQRQLVAEFDASNEQVIADLDGLVRQLRDHGLISITEST